MWLNITASLVSPLPDLPKREHPDFPKPNFATDDKHGWTWCYPLKDGLPQGDGTLCWSKYYSIKCPQSYVPDENCNIDWPWWYSFAQTPLCVNTS